MLPNLENCSIGIIGLGYVGLPLALQIAKQTICLLNKNKLERLVFGYDINEDRIEELSEGLIETKYFLKNKLKILKILNLLVKLINLKILMFLLSQSQPQ